MGKLALFTLLSAAAQAPETDRKQVYIFADEFQRLMSQNLEIFFEQARSMKLSFILANQDLSQLSGKGVDLLNLVESCTAVKQVFTAPDKETIEMLSRFSGEGLYHQAGWRELLDRRVDDKRDDTFSMKRAYPTDPTSMAITTVSEHNAPRLDVNTIIEVSADPLGSFVRFAQSSGFTRFSGYVTPILSEYHISEDEYKARASTPWPTLSDETLLVGAKRSEPKGAARKQDQSLKKPEPDTYEIEALEAKLDQALKPGKGAIQ